MNRPVSLRERREQKKRDDYKRLVLAVYDDMEHADKRELLGKKSEVERKARERL